MKHYIFAAIILLSLSACHNRPGHDHNGHSHEGHSHEGHDHSDHESHDHNATTAPNANTLTVEIGKEKASQLSITCEPAVSREINSLIKVTGELISKPGDEIVIASTSAGIVKFIGSDIMDGAAVKAGEKLFAISGDNIALENIDQEILQARLVAQEAKAEYERISVLMEDKLVLREEYRTAKLKHESSQLRLNNLTRNYSASGKMIASPINGFIKNVNTSDGGYVTEGQPLAVVFRNKKLLLKADVPMRDFERAKNTTEANFRISQSDSLFDTRSLGGRVVATGKVASANSAYVPIFFEIQNDFGLLPGSPATVFLKSCQKEIAIALPSSCLMEEQGVYFVFVQITPEQYEKRQVTVKVNDASTVFISDGIKEGECVVVKSAYQIKLASQSGSLPAHGHHH